LTVHCGLVLTFARVQAEADMHYLTDAATAAPPDFR
jgi:hypothetical protein